MTAKPLLPLRPNQAQASVPYDNAWVSASAGTGKTQVLTARVLRLLLSGATPERILCLTFTKAAAAEMQERIFGRLTRWVRCSDAELDADLAALGEREGDTPRTELRQRARQLFARVVDARGGLSVQTFHSFAQSLLAGFPVEAGIAPGFSVLDDRTGVELRERVLVEALAESGFADDVSALAVKLGEAKLHGVVQSLLARRDGVRALGHPMGHPALLRRRLKLPAEGSREDALIAAMAAFDCVSLTGFAAACDAWGAKSGADWAVTVRTWVGEPPERRAVSFGELRVVFLTGSGAPRKLTDKFLGVRVGLDATVARICAAIGEIVELEAGFDVLEIAARHLRVGHAVEAGFRTHKARSGLLDFDDMIARAAAMLGQDGMGDWVRFKLDERIDHILVDEGQDTNARQWAITRAIADEFFAGRGQRENDAPRTLFAVGDYKQAIFSFQGSDPKVFDASREHFEGLARDSGEPFHDVPLAESFRSGGAVLETVDQVIDDLGFETLGLTQRPERHAVGRPGDPHAQVTLWPPVLDGADASEEADGEAGWLAGSVRLFAGRLAKQIRHWLDDPDMRLANGRRVRPEDVLVLVRQRGEFVGALVAALHAEAVPVAGVDRLRLTAPIAVQDCLSLIRFALQPGDDLTLAELLTSPFLGWDQDALFAAAHGRGRDTTLWRRLRAMDGAGAEAAVAWLSGVLDLADRMPPHEFLETILSGPLGGRAKLLARLGEEARDQVEALLAQALAFEHGHAPSLQGFLAWIENDEFDLKRDPDAPNDAVRVMTVHGAKGLQAPVVVLADAARGPGGMAPDHVVLPWGPGDEDIPVFFGGKAGRIGEIADELDRAEIAATEEHWRLLYVAMTRAEDYLFVGGALGPRDSAAVANGKTLSSWHEAMQTALERLGAAQVEGDALWGEVGTPLLFAKGVRSPPSEPDRAEAARVALPGWARALPAAEPVPPRPLSPSQLAADDEASPPPSQAMLDAARKGSLLHKLFERLPGVAPDRRHAAALAWLARQAGDLSEAVRAGLAAQALGIIDTPAFADVFGPDALAEAPIAAVVDGVVIAGKVDRLLIQGDRVQVVDFKTGRAVPADADGVSAYHLKQMAAYAAALRVVFPGKRVEAALLYTEVARLIELPEALLAANAPVLSSA